MGYIFSTDGAKLSAAVYAALLWSPIYYGKNLEFELTSAIYDVRGLVKEQSAIGCQDRPGCDFPANTNAGMSVGEILRMFIPCDNSPMAVKNNYDASHSIQGFLPICHGQVPGEVKV